MGVELRPEDDADPNAIETAAASVPDREASLRGRRHGPGQRPQLAKTRRCHRRRSADIACVAGQKSEVGVAVAPRDGAKGKPAGSSSPCDPEDTVVDDDEETPFIGPEVDDWAVDVTPRGYVARHLEHSAIKLTLEMYGSGEPELLHWQRLNGSLRAIGLLHYYAGASPKGEPLEGVRALINVCSGKLIAIEPCRWGDQLASWAWSDTSVVVVDPQGVPSEVKVAERAEPTAARARTAKARRAEARLSHPQLERPTAAAALQSLWTPVQSVRLPLLGQSLNPNPGA